MKKLDLIFIIIFFHGYFNIYSQDQEWINLNPSFTPEGNYNLVWGTFVNDKVGWFATYGEGKILKTNDGGYNWELQIKNSGSSLYDLEVVDSLVVYAIIDVTSIIKTIDGGKSWQTLSVPGSRISCLKFINDTIGYASGDGSIYYTDDGGERWHEQIVQTEIPFMLIEIFFIDDQNGWAVGVGNPWISGIILKTTNGGEVWQVVPEILIPTGYAVFFYRYTFRLYRH